MLTTASAMVELIATIIVFILVALGPLVPLLIARFINTENPVLPSKVMLVSSIIAVMLFIICISVPYHFQGYQELENPSRNSEVLGLTRYWPVLAFSAIYASPLGTVWLLLSLVFTIFGEFANKIVSVWTKIILAILISFCLYHMQNYQETIGVILEF